MTTPIVTEVPITQPIFALAPLYGPITLETQDMLERWTDYRAAPASSSRNGEFPGLAVARCVVRAALHPTSTNR